MDDIMELIKQYGLEEDQEHIIIPYIDKNGKKKRCYLLKRRFIRVVYSDEHFVDYPIADAVRATIKYPDILLSEALYLMHKESNGEVSETDKAGFTE